MVVLRYCGICPWLHSRVGSLLCAVDSSLRSNEVAVAAAEAGVAGEVADGLCLRVHEAVGAVLPEPLQRCDPH